MKRLIMLLFCLIITMAGFCNGRKKNMFPIMEISDSLGTVLDSIYHAKINMEFPTCTTRPYIWNLLNHNDLKFHQGIYTYKGNGPHFPRLIFIYYNKKIFSFSSWGLETVLQEFVKAIDVLDITENDQYIYMKAICKYLEEEEYETYGGDPVRSKDNTNNVIEPEHKEIRNSETKAEQIENQIIEESRKRHKTK